MNSQTSTPAPDRSCSCFICWILVAGLLFVFALGSLWLINDRAKGELGQADLQQLQGKVAGLQQEKAQLSQQQTALEQSLSDAGQASQELKNELSRAKAKYDAQAKELAKLEQQQAQKSRPESREGGQSKQKGGDQEVASLQQQLKNLSDERDRLRAETQDIQAQLQPSRNSAQQAQDKLEAANQKIASLQQQVNNTTVEQEQISARSNDLQTRLKQSQQMAQQTQDNLADEVAQNKRLEQNMASLSSLVPPEHGGKATLAQAQSRASAAFNSYRDAYRSNGLAGRDKAQTKTALSDASRELQSAQLLAASLTHATGVYWVRSRDTLSQIASLTLGGGWRWPSIYSANRHLLDNPDRLTPGMTLIIP